MIPWAIRCYEEYCYMGKVKISLQIPSQTKKLDRAELESNT